MISLKGLYYLNQYNTPQNPNFTQSPDKKLQFEGMVSGRSFLNNRNKKFNKNQFKKRAKQCLQKRLTFDDLRHILTQVSNSISTNKPKIPLKQKKNEKLLKYLTRPNSVNSSQMGPFVTMRAKTSLGTIDKNHNNFFRKTSNTPNNSYFTKNQKNCSQEKQHQQIYKIEMNYAFVPSGRLGRSNHHRYYTFIH